MLLHKITITFCFFLVGCGFQPIYSSKNHSTNALETLASVEVVPIERSMTLQYLTSHLEDLLNPTAISVAPKYKLDIRLHKTESPLAIQRDRTITRYKMRILANYSLVDLDNKKVVESGVIKRDGGYDRVESDYSTFVSEASTTKRIAKELAEDLKLIINGILL